MKSIPTIMKYMTTTPHSVNAQEPIEIAYNMMKEHHIRHLPVLEEGQIKGIVSERDLRLAFSIRGIDPKTTKINEISNEDVFLVRPESKLDEVVRMMGEKKIGSVLVVDHHRLVGIFTTTDALHALDELLKTRLQ